MKKFILPAALMSAVMLSAWAGSPKDTDPVVMNINGKDIHRSEFEYLYNKNNRQQAEPQSMADYVEMFITYKLKVAEAEAAGLDTTSTFVSEFDRYCADITNPYLVDTLVTDRLVEESYNRMRTIRDVSHIMVPIGGPSAQREYFKHKIDSIHDVIVNKGGNFEELAMEYSTDRNTGVNGGHMGEIAVNRLPYKFEKGAYDTPVGGISAVIEDEPYGWHIIKVNSERPYPGRVTARHILKLTQGLSPEEAAVKKAEIDSLYGLIRGGKPLAVLA
ncbi:MAG: peptidylprolyl isomerase, partial [Duncaniella sp.]|nr:peptidylprolyl isomerase [Duncaniella sp.]